MNLLSNQSLVESPFVIVKIGNYTFGNFSKQVDKKNKEIEVTYPNYMQSINIVKVNGAVNTYTIKMVYAITQDSDPNMLEAVFSSVSSTRKILISYGDWESPSFIYKDEEAIITKILSSVDISGSKISYTIYCTSDSLKLRAGFFDFHARTDKPSDVIREMLYDKKFGLTDIFYGMRDKQKVNDLGLIASNDKKVKIEAKRSTSVLDYLNYLVECMASVEDTEDSPIKNSRYYLNIYDDTTNELGGTYFKVVEVTANSKDTFEKDVFEIDVGYPGKNYVTSFTLKNDEQWSILYNYSDDIKLPSYIYRLDDEGKIYSEYSKNITTSPVLLRTTETNKTWWTNMTQFPISANITIKGLLRPSVLMSYVRLNVYFYGHKYIASGKYIITRQSDTIDSNGYRTELTLTRVGGDI